MKLSGTYDLPAPREQVFQAITDPAVIQSIIDGCEKMVKTGDHSYDAHLKIGLAGIKGTYVGKIQLTDLQAPESYTLRIEGKGAPGFIQGIARVQLSENGAHTRLGCDAEAKVGGMIAAVGSRLIEAAAKKMMADFFQKLAAKLQTPPPRVSLERRGTRPSSHPPPAEHPIMPTTIHWRSVMDVWPTHRTLGPGSK